MLLLNKDRITAGDGARAHDLEGKAEISNKTNGKVFGILNAAGKTHIYIYFNVCYTIIGHNNTKHVLIQIKRP